MDLTEAFPGGSDAADDLGKTDFFDFVVSPLSAAPSHCSGTIDDDTVNYLQHRQSRRMYLQDGRRDDDGREIHSTSTSFIKQETNNNTLTALPPVSTITGSLNHHVRNHCIQSSEIPMEADCDYWGTSDDVKDGQQTCNILLEDLNKYCWTTHANPQCRDDVNDTEGHHQNPHHRVSVGNDRHQNTDGAIYTLTVLNNETNSMDGLDCCKSPVASNNDSWTLRPNLDLDAILNLESSHPDADSVHDVQNSAEIARNNERYHIISTTPSSQYATDDSGFVERDNNNDWKLSDQNHLQEVSGDSAESLLRNALQGKLYSGPTQITLASSTKSTGIAVSLSTGSNAQIKQEPQDESMHGCTEEDLLLSQLETTTYRPGDYEKLKSIANEVVENYCNLEPVCSVSGTTTLMYTLDPTSGSLGTITLPAELGQVGTVTVVTAAPQELIDQTTARSDDSAGQIQVVAVNNRPMISNSTTAAKPAKKYSRKNNRNAANANSAAAGANGSVDSGNQSAPGSSPSATVQRKERSLHYCNICHKGFKDKYSVNVHIRTHTGEKPFACSLCGKSFRQKAHLAKHYQTHVTQKPNVGNGCTTSGSNSSNSTRGSHGNDTAVCSPSS
ncbi:zinc finger E-box-binding homeobox 1 isoform X2 [Cotesia glomerata]|uniref:C2H2-type domain-containing protein n=1 Tax=Cotesia glomerata TaxID=32391 RepID=A0AAV7INV7_COTGL|nr:zinc finger E-box-binding homeobox 1 isoform X2 [Cotesia glomerata]KAH0553924.1 hypothetical protein KQX54_005885 [Cotesia glomerata]